MPTLKKKTVRRKTPVKKKAPPRATTAGKNGQKRDPRPGKRSKLTRTTMAAGTADVPALNAPSSRPKTAAELKVDSALLGKMKDAMLHHQETKERLTQAGYDLVAGRELDLLIEARRWLRFGIVSCSNSPMLQGRFTEGAREAMRRNDQCLPKTKQPRDIDREFLTAAHICKGSYDLKQLKKNLYGMQAIGLKKALATAFGRYFPDAFTKVSVMGTVFVNGPYDGLFPLYAELPPDPLKPEKGAKPAIPERVEICVCPKKNDNNAGKAVLVYKPLFRQWASYIDIGFNPDIIPVQNLVDGLTYAGWYVGLGSGRKETGWENGSFELKRCMVLPEDFVAPCYHNNG